MMESFLVSLCSLPAPFLFQSEDWTTPDLLIGGIICYKNATLVYSGIPISRTSRGNANWFEKSGVREIEGGIKLRLIDRVLFGYE